MDNPVLSGETDLKSVGETDLESVGETLVAAPAPDRLELVGELDEI